MVVCSQNLCASSACQYALIYTSIKVLWKRLGYLEHLVMSWLWNKILEFPLSSIISCLLGVHFPRARDDIYADFKILRDLRSSELPKVPEFRVQLSTDMRLFDVSQIPREQ